MNGLSWIINSFSDTLNFFSKNFYRNFSVTKIDTMGLIWAWIPNWRKFEHCFFFLSLLFWKVHFSTDAAMALLVLVAFLVALFFSSFLSSCLSFWLILWNPDFILSSHLTVVSIALTFFIRWKQRSSGARCAHSWVRWCHHRLQVRVWDERGLFE